MTDKAAPAPASLYRGRFAPSPTGLLHFGSLITAVASFLEARSRDGEWLVRIEDLDPPREVPGASGAILRTLEAYGLHWDGPVMYQSRRTDAYEEALARLQSLSVVYPCGCSRRDILEAARTAPDGRAIYPGTCRNRIPPGRIPRAIRLRTTPETIAFTDRIQGEFRQALEDEVGDFVVRRAEGWHAYQLAVVVDDAAQGVTDVVRGSDLLDSTPRQIYLQRLLGLPTPTYAHLPVAVNDQGEKLSKQTGAPKIPPDDPVPHLFAVLQFLNQQPPPELRYAALDEFWVWAVAHWRPNRIPRVPAIPAYPCANHLRESD
ncbi:MAG: tRNA glutamyl-Q(34) synthetase GluQRS [Gammaproteobacteria bacterium]